MRRRLLVLLSASLGAAVAALPAVAGSETAPTVTAENFGGGIYGESHAWNPRAVAVGQGGVVPFGNPTEVAHGVHWVYSPATPSCSGVPVGTTPESAAAKWSGTCSFSVPGTYTFYCTVHGAAMAGTITVSAASTTSPPPPTTTGTAPTTTSAAPSGSETTSTPATGSPLAGGASAALKLPASQHGATLRGSIAVSQAGAGGRLQVDALAKSASLASVSAPRSVRVGETVRSSLRPGRVVFSVPLSARARAAIRRHGRLALTVRVVVKPTSGAAVTVTRAVVVHR